jgi:ribosomal protein L37AE/L43A
MGEKKIKEEKKTLNSRIDELVKEVSAKIEEHKDQSTEWYNSLRADIKEIAERAASPESFCDECDDRMVFDFNKRILKCINCGYERQTLPVVSTPEKQIAIVEDIIKREEVRKPIPGEIANRIRELANSGGNSNSKADAADTNAVLGTGAPVNKNINWV